MLSLNYFLFSLSLTFSSEINVHIPHACAHARLEYGDKLNDAWLSKYLGNKILLACVPLTHNVKICDSRIISRVIFIPVILIALSNIPMSRVKGVGSV